MSKPDTGKTSVAIVISDLEFGGAQQQVVALANNIDPDLYDLHIISMADFVPLAEQLSIPDGRLHIVSKRWKSSPLSARRSHEEYDDDRADKL